MQTTGPLLALSTAAMMFGACSDGGRPPPQPITWRVPCASLGSWAGGSVNTTTYVYDERKHWIERTTVNASGVTTSHTRRGFDVDRLLWIEATGDYRTDYTYDDGGRLIRKVRASLVELGEFGSEYTATYGYDDDDWMVSIDTDNVYWADTHSTITGELSTRQTCVTCLVESPIECNTSVFEQPDRDPSHWTVATFDYDSDGTLDYREERTLDDNGLELSQIEFDAAGVLNDRSITQREADGTVLRTLDHRLDSTGRVTQTYTVENLFSCP